MQDHLNATLQELNANITIHEMIHPSDNGNIQTTILGVV